MMSVPTQFLARACVAMIEFLPEAHCQHNSFHSHTSKWRASDHIQVLESQKDIEARTTRHSYNLTLVKYDSQLTAIQI
jgi:hypothetical protein